MKKFLSIFLSIIIAASVNFTVIAAPIPFDDDEEKAFYAGYELYEIIYLLSQEYVGGDVTVEELFDSALYGIASSLDQYSQYMSETDFNHYVEEMAGDIVSIGIEITTDYENRIVVRDVYEDSPAKSGGLAKGDIIISVNSTPVTSPYHVSELVQTSKSPEIEIEIERNSEVMNLKITSEHTTIRTVYSYGIEEVFEVTEGFDNSKIGYMEILSFYENTANEFIEELKKLKDNDTEYLILDLRDNGGGYLASVIEIAQHIVPKGAIFYTLTKDGNKEVENSNLEESPFKHIVVLINENTASASEILAAALQDSGTATLVGQKSFGKGVIQFMCSTVTGGGFKYTAAEYLRRSGKPLNNIGIVPDISIDRPDFILPITLDSSGQSPGVVGLKKILTYIGYEISDDTNFLDDNTKEQLKDFQNHFELEQTGMPDEDTVSALNEMLYVYYTYADKELEAAYEFILSKEGN